MSEQEVTTDRMELYNKIFAGIVIVVFGLLLGAFAEVVWSAFSASLQVYPLW